MNRQFLGVGAGLLAMVALTACEQTRQALGQTKRSPDEFAVYTRAPLSTPPDFQLRPPTPGAQRPQAVNPRDRVERTIIDSAGGTARRPADTERPVAGASAGENAILRAAGALNTDPAIRLQVDSETRQIVAESEDFAEKLVFWRDPPDPSVTVDPVAESKRIRDTQALGKPINEGDVPVIERKKRAILEGLF